MSSPAEQSKPKLIKHGNMETEKDVLSSLVSGACAGALAKTVIAPLDRTKIMFQVSKTEFSYKTAANIMYKGYKKNGFLSWWRGNSATMARVIPYAAIQFTTHEQMKLYLAGGKKVPLPPEKRFLAGSIAGLVACTFTYPLDLVRARLAIAQKLKYKSLRHAFRTIYKEEGFMRFYNGYIPTVLGIMPYAGTSFFIYETLKQKYHKENPTAELTFYHRFGYGAVAGVCGQSFSYPLDIVRRRMQTDGLDGKGYKYKKLVGTLRYIFLSEGFIKGLYKGLSINWIKGPIAVGVSFATFDKVQMLFHRMPDYIT
ncbi:mitochondrial coenzyme A transporter SLC25A42-like [Clytia hemisphaerica]|uniref:Uncharacterized protein n=1 Tax=Clytia hemisphaerica TaxID=252671 RepID=A0A7M5V1P5_9CNID